MLAVLTPFQCSRPFAAPPFAPPLDRKVLGTQRYNTHEYAIRHVALFKGSTTHAPQVAEGLDAKLAVVLSCVRDTKVECVAKAWAVVRARSMCDERVDQKGVTHTAANLAVL